MQICSKGDVAVEDHQDKNDEHNENEDIALDAAGLLDFGIFKFCLFCSLWGHCLVLLLEFWGLQVLCLDALLLWFEADRYLLDDALVRERADFNLRSEGLQLVLFLDLNSYVVLVRSMRFTRGAHFDVFIGCVDGEVGEAQDFHDLSRLFER